MSFFYQIFYKKDIIAVHKFEIVKTSCRYNCLTIVTSRDSIDCPPLILLLRQWHIYNEYSTCL